MRSKLEVSFENIYTFVCNANNQIDFAQRLQVFSSVVILELSERINSEKPYSSFGVSKIVDDLNEEVKDIVYDINETKILLEGQPQIKTNVLLRLIKISSSKLYVDYKYAKQIHKN